MFHYFDFPLSEYRGRVGKRTQLVKTTFLGKGLKLDLWPTTVNYMSISEVGVLVYSSLMILIMTLGTINPLQGWQ